MHPGHMHVSGSSKDLVKRKEALHRGKQAGKSLHSHLANRCSCVARLPSLKTACCIANPIQKKATTGPTGEGSPLKKAEPHLRILVCSAPAGCCWGRLQDHRIR